MAVKKTTESYIEEVKKIHKDKYDYSLLEYKTIFEPIIIICPIHGEFTKKATNHLRGRGCPKCSQEKDNERNLASLKYTVEEFRKICKEVSPQLNFDKTIYINDKNSVIVTCPHHGDFKARAANLINGSTCRKCTTRKIDYDKEFERLRILHNNKYDYSLIDRTKNVNSKQTIICNEHGEFKQMFKSHQDGHGCKICCTAGGFTRASFKKSAGGNKTTVYFVKLYDEHETFYKVGITTKSIENRFKTIPYKYEIINFKTFDDPLKTYNLEKRFFKLYYKSKYKPLKKFGGSGECFI